MSDQPLLSNKLPAALSVLALATFLLGSLAAHATLIDVNLVLKPSKDLKEISNPDGSGVGTWDDQYNTLVLKTFAFEKTGTEFDTSPANLGKLIELASGNFVLQWVTDAVVFDIADLKQGVGIGGAYSGNGWSGSWKLSERSPSVSVSEPGSVALLGVVLLGLGLARRYATVVRRLT